MAILLTQRAWRRCSCTAPFILLWNAQSKADPLKRVWTDDFAAVALAKCVAFIVVERAGAVQELLDVAAGGGRGAACRDASRRPRVRQSRLSGICGMGPSFPSFHAAEWRRDTLSTHAAQCSFSRCEPRGFHLLRGLAAPDTLRDTPARVDLALRLSSPLDHVGCDPSRAMRPRICRKRLLVKYRACRCAAHPP